MFKRVNWLAMWLISMVTLGIYKVIVWYRMTKQQNEMAARMGEKKVLNYIVVLLLGTVTGGIFTVIWLLFFCKQQKNLAMAKGIDLTPSSKTFVRWLLMLVPVYKYYMVCRNHNMLCEVYQDE